MGRRVAVVGCGSIGARYVGWLVELGHQVIAIDTRLEARAAAASHPGVIAAQTVEAALAHGPDAAIIATPPAAHDTPALAFLAAGCDVLVEKPLCADLPAARALAAAAARLPGRCAVVCNMRFHPGPQAIHANLARIGRPLASAGSFGHRLEQMRPGRDLQNLYAASSADGGGIVADCIHEIDLGNWLFGTGTCQFSSLANLDHPGLPFDDFACVVVAHASGVRSILTFDYLQRHKRRTWLVHGTEGSLLWEGTGKVPERCVVRFLSQPAVEVIMDEEVDGLECYRAMLRHFLTRPRWDGVLQSLDEAVSALGVALAPSRLQ